MKCQCLFSRKNKKNISSRLNFLPSIQSVMVSLGRYPTVLQNRRFCGFLFAFLHAKSHLKKKVLLYEKENNWFGLE